MLCTGTVRGKMIELGMPVPFRDGQLVDLSIEPVEEDQRGTIAALRQAMHEPPHVSREDVDELLRIIKEARTPTSSRGIFDEDD